MNFSFKDQSLIALFASTILTSGMAVAADAIDVRNVADPVRHPYQQTAVGNCVTPNPNGCLVVFPAITTARTLVLHASCSTSLTDPAIVTEVFLSDSPLFREVRKASAVSAHIVPKLFDDLLFASNRLGTPPRMLGRPSVDVFAQPRELEKRLP
jgi:hypothetical protein